VPPDDIPPALRPHLKLALVPGLGPKLTRAVLEHFGTADAVLAASANQLQAVPLIGEKLAAQFVAAFKTVDETAEWELLTKHGVSVSLPGEPAYPDRWCVISGLARGIDGAAHKGALKAGGRTLAVLAGGLSRIYPPEHDALAEQVAAQGALLTETPLTVPPQPGMFPARNRIISALSRCVVVIEANAKSGALITATHAAEQGREVFALPGNADSAASAGCLELIRKGVRLVRSADDILEDLRGIAPPDPPKRIQPPEKRPTLFDPPPPPAEPPPGLDELQRRIWDALTEPKHADVLSREVGLPAHELTGVLTKMEMRRAVRRLPGNTFERR
jgi:DNA processing protein